MLAFHNEHIASCAFLTYFSPEGTTTAANSPTTPQATVLNDKTAITGMMGRAFSSNNASSSGNISRHLRLQRPYILGMARLRCDMQQQLQQQQHQQQLSHQQHQHKQRPQRQRQLLQFVQLQQMQQFIKQQQQQQQQLQNLQHQRQQKLLLLPVNLTHSNLNGSAGVDAVGGSSRTTTTATIETATIKPTTTITTTTASEILNNC